MIFKRIAFFAIGFAAILLLFRPAKAQSVGESYLLTRPGKTIPGHPGPGERAVSCQFADGTVAKITSAASDGNWFQVEAAGVSAWIIKKYIGEKSESPSGGSAGLTYTVGTWNLEWFKDEKLRGYPEYTYTPAGPKIPPRTEEDYTAIAEVISQDLGAAVMVLDEINGPSSEFEEPPNVRSPEMDLLLSRLGANFDYVLSSSGGDQHVAILFDKSKVRLNNVVEIHVPPTKVQGDDIFARDPLVAHFTFLANGTDQHLSDFVLVGLHLASGQSQNKNHDAAFKILTQELDKLLQTGEVLPQGEKDIILAGDLNLDFFDNKKETYLEQMEAGPYNVLADPGYPATRLAGVPLQPKSRIDYIIATDLMVGSGKEIGASQASVHQELANGNFDAYRRVFSDHFPVTISVRILPDDD